MGCHSGLDPESGFFLDSCFRRNDGAGVDDAPSGKKVVFPMTSSEANSSRTTATLPDGWRIVRLVTVCEIIAGQSPPSATYRNEPQGLPFFQGKADFGPIHPVARVWCTEPIKIAMPGDILLSVRAPVGPTNIADIKICIGRGLAAIRCSQDVARDFILYALRLLEQELVAKGAGSTFEAITIDDLKRLEIPLPPLVEQRRIAVILNEQMAAVARARKAAEARREAALALYDSFVQAVFDSKQSSSWPKKELLDACERPGQYGTSQKSNSHGQGTPILGMSHIHDGRIRWENVWHVALEESEKAKYLLSRGDLLFNRTNSAELVGKTAVFDLDREAVFASYLVRFRMKSELADPHFVSAYINSRDGRDFVAQNMARAIGQVNISASTMHKMQVPLPQLAVQQSISRMLSERQTQLSDLEANLKAELESLEALPAAILRKAFAGDL